ncbi:MAG: ribose 5-phosphate isomerase B [Geminicoccaceae bacterium]|nr:ribose 5-phosphate isomerase B [Geminicoccaceae bacterium]MCB9945625.1 ribose 5-phosphate isomerase B [Geminicoccaceae bacterium]
MNIVTVALAADHAGYELKNLLVHAVRERGLEALDLGTHSADSVDYPDMADRVSRAIADARAQRGVLVCGTGIGISIAANRAPHIRCGLCHDVTTARLTRQHNDANVLALGGRIVGIGVALDCLAAFLDTPYEGGRHARRVGKLSSVPQNRD